MTADRTDIRFECEKCGQRLVVEPAGAGLAMDCPICNTTVTVPKASPTAETPAGGDAGRARHGLASVPYADPGPDDLREELIDASLINGKLLGDLTKAREELARLHQQVKALSEENEHLHASATHTQAELKAFQAERPQFKAEITSLRQRLAASDEALAESGSSVAERESELAVAKAALERAEGEAAKFEAKAAALEQALAAEHAHREELTTELADRRREISEVHGRIAQRKNDLQTARNRVAELESALTAATDHGARMEAERNDLKLLLDEARADAAAAGDLRNNLDRTAAELLDQSEKLRAAEESNQALTIRCDTLRRESDTLRRDLAESHTGREILHIRAQFEGALAEQEAATARAQSLEADLRAFEAADAELRRELDAARQERDEAVGRADALGESRYIKDNEVLRGIVARLNGEIAQRTAEVHRLKRARYSLKFAYVLFGIGLLAVVIFALVVLPRALR